MYKPIHERFQSKAFAFVIFKKDLIMLSPHSRENPSKIFISYRRSESAAYAGRLSDQLRVYFGSQIIFIDVESIEPGRDFVEAIEDAVSSCKILLVVIGRQWLTCANERGRRLDDPKDFVRLEISAALKRNIRVIPVLVQGATMPREEDLPDEIIPLARRQAWEVSDIRWNQDVGRLIEKIAGDIPGSVHQSTPEPSLSPQAGSKKIPIKPLIAVASLFVIAVIYAYSYGIGIREIVVGTIIILILLSLLHYLQNKYPQLAETNAENVEPDVKRFFDSLKERYQNRFQSKLDGRFEMTLEVVGDIDSPNPHLISERFDDKAGEGKTTEIIREMFENRDRLLIVGSAGSGKTTLLLRLAVSLLDKVELAGDEAFPVIFTLASWSNEYDRLEDWLKVSLESGYDLSKDFAATLLRQERIIPLFDGLDELAKYEGEQLAPETRGEFLRSLNQYLTRGRKVVVSCRRDEFLLIQKFKGHDAPVAATVALLDLTKEQIEKALSEAEHRRDSKGRRVDETSAKHILEFLRRDKDDVLLDTLRTPFYFNTALEVFNKPILDDEQLPDNTEDLKKYLLDKFVAAKLYRTPNPNNFESEKTRKWLIFLGRELEFTRSLDFELSSPQPDSLSRAWVYELLYGSVTASGIHLCFGFVYSFLYSLYVIYKLLDGSHHGSGHYSRIQTEDIRRLNVANLLSPRKLKRGLIYGLVSGVLAFLIFSLRGHLVESAVAASVLGLFIGVREIVGEVSYFVNVKTPYQRLKAGFIEKGLILAVVCLLMNFLSLSAPYNELTWNDIRFLLFSFFGGAIIGFSSAPLFRHCILRLCLYIERKAPLRYATFLDYTADARILEKDGGQWRFRHQHLQTYLADMPRKGVRRIIEEL